MKLEDIQNQWENDSKIDRAELGEESLKIPQLHAKYFKIFSEERMKLRALQRSYNNFKRDKYEYYNGTASQDVMNTHGWEPNPLKILKSDIPMYLEGDIELQGYASRVDIQQDKVDFVESIIKNLPSRGYQIKAAIDWEKFKVGA